MAFARSSDDRDRVKSATDIVRLIGDHVTVRAKGREYACLCPFHDDHNPSMSVVPSKQIYYCFVCGAGGDVFDFVMNYHRMEFREALEFLADRAGIKLEQPQPGSASGPAGPSRTDILGACSIAQSFFRAMLRREDLGAPAREALRARGISDAMIERFGLGASPDRPDGLASVVAGKNLDARSFGEAGLLYVDRGPPADVFRGRIMFPIRDQIGRVIAFGARIIEGDGPKYLNSRETRVFHKSDALYGLAEASEAIRSTRTAIITEGYTDVIACHQAEVCNVVGTLGTSLTTGHARVLRRLCDRVVLLFDGDDAGLRAADRAIEVFFREPIDVAVATLSSVSTAKDPDELLHQEGGRDLLMRAIESAPDLLTFRFARLRQRLSGASPTATAEAVQQEMDRLVELGLRDVSPVLRQMVIRQIARVAGVDESVILKALPAGRRPRPRDDEAPTATSPAPIGARERALGLLMLHPTLARTVRDEDAALLAPLQSGSSIGHAVALTVTQFLADGREPGLDSVLSELEGEARAEAVRYLRAVETSAAAEPDIGASELRELLRRLANDAVPTLGAEASFEARLQAIRQRHADFGPDRRRAPRIRTVPER